MSEFDKEAEREKLRKQYEKDKEKREKSERMSELLLQGATMTDTHCSECGDPIFSHQGQKFCPTCQREVREQKPEATEQQPEQEQPMSELSASEDDAAEIEINGAITRENASMNTTESEPKNEHAVSATRSSSDPSTDEHPQSQPQQQPQAQPQSQPETSSDLSAARQSLIRIVTRFARRAESAEDLTTAREFLKATEDAATALDALKQAKQ